MKKSFSNTLSFWVLPGFIAGMAFLGITLVAGATTTNFWAMPDAIAHVMGIAVPAGYGFAPVPVLVGIVVHLAFSIVLGVIFTAFALWRRLHGWILVVAGVLFIMLETPISLWVVLHNLLPTTTFYYFLGALPWWGSVFGRCIYGLVLGLLLNHFANGKPQESAIQQAGERLASRG